LSLSLGLSHWVSLALVSVTVVSPNLNRMIVNIR